MQTPNFDGLAVANNALAIWQTRPVDKELHCWAYIVVFAVFKICISIKASLPALERFVVRSNFKWRLFNKRAQRFDNSHQMKAINLGCWVILMYVIELFVPVSNKSLLSLITVIMMLKKDSFQLKLEWAGIDDILIYGRDWANTQNSSNFNFSLWTTNRLPVVESNQS